MSEVNPKLEKQDYSWVALVSDTYGLAIESQPVLLHQHDEQRIFRLNTSAGTSLILRLCPPSRSYQQVQNETQILLYLSRHKFPAPVLRLTRAGQALFEWQAGCWGYVQDFIEGEHPRLNLATIEEIAGLLGRLHTLTDNAAPFPVQLDWLDDLDNSIKRAENCASDPKWGQQAQEVAASLRSLPSLRGLPIGIVHTDPHEGNFLRTPDGQFIMLDWEYAGMGQMIIDLGMVLGWLCLWPAYRDINGALSRNDADYDEEWCKTFLAVYQQTRPLSWEEAQHLGPAIRFVIGWFAARDIENEVKETGTSEDGLAFFHWAVVHSLTPARESLLTKWAIETGPQTQEDKSKI